MLTPDFSIECSQARDAASTRLDTPLPELDEARLDAHLDACPDCRAFALEAAGIARLLRAAPLEQPGRPMFVPAPVPILASGRKRPLVRLQALAAAVVLLAAAISTSFALGRAIGGQRHTSARATATASADVLGLRADSAQQHLLGMISRLQPVGTMNTGRAIAL